MCSPKVACFCSHSAASLQCLSTRASRSLRASVRASTLSCSSPSSEDMPPHFACTSCPAASSSLQRCCSSAHVRSHLSQLFSASARIFAIDSSASRSASFVASSSRSTSSRTACSASLLVPGDAVSVDIASSRANSSAFSCSATCRAPCAAASASRCS